MPVETVTRRPLKTRGAGWAVRLAHGLASAGMPPNYISVASVVMSIAAAGCLVSGLYLPAALFIQLRLLCNLMDGMVAVEGGRGSASGEIYNDLPDRISDILILAGAGYGAAWPVFARELGWIASFLAVMTAYVRVLGGACGLTQDFRGVMAKPRRMAVLTVACIAATLEPRAIALGLMIVIVGSLLTAAARVRRIVRQLEGSV